MSTYKVAPAKCDACGGSITTVFYDMRSKYGPWGDFCKECAYNGVGCGRLGTGHGQEYTKQPDGRFLKTVG